LTLPRSSSVTAREAGDIAVAWRREPQVFHHANLAIPNALFQDSAIGPASILGHTRRNNSQPKRLADRQTQSIDQALVVGLVAEDPLTRIAPARDMLDGARVLDSQRPAHSSCLTLANVA